MEETHLEDSSTSMNKNQPDISQIDNLPEVVGRPLTPNIPECRICLEPQSEVTNKLVSPCNCTGSVMNIHENCFKAWIQKKSENPKTRQQIYSDTGINCEICNQKFQYSYQTDKKCASSKYFWLYMKKHKVFSITLILFAIIDISIISALGWYAFQDRLDKNFDIKLPRYFLIYASLVFALGGLLFVVYEFMNFFCMQSKHTIIPENKIRKMILTKEQRVSIISDISGINFQNTGMVKVSRRGSHM